MLFLRAIFAGKENTYRGVPLKYMSEDAFKKFKEIHFAVAFDKDGEYLGRFASLQTAARTATFGKLCGTVVDTKRDIAISYPDCKRLSA